MKKKNVVVLMPELVPSPLWGRSVHKMLGSTPAWKKEIRMNALLEANNCCSICKSSEGRMTCHEKWRYADKQLTAILFGFQINCVNCDLVTHAGRAFKLGYGEIVISHLCKINEWNIDRAVAVLNEAMDVWTKRSEKEWTITVTSSLVKRYPKLAALPEFIPPPINY